MDIGKMDEELKKNGVLESISRLEESLKQARAVENPFARLVAHYEEKEIRPAVSLARLPSPKEQNEYQSAGVLLRRLAETLTEWRNNVPEGEQPAIIAILSGGVQIAVDRLSEEGFHGIRIEGKLGKTQCMVLSHQASVQLLCFVQEATVPPRPIGFVIDGKESSV